MHGSRLGPYRLDDLLGEGGMGHVYAATVVGYGAALPKGERLAVKVLRPELADVRDVVARFEREVRLGAGVLHENLVRTFGGGVAHADGRALRYLAMELVEGQTLREVLGELSRLPEHLCRHVASRVVSGLAALHAAGVVHRDVKPENVLITPDNRVKLMDLGVACETHEASGGTFVGSLAYAAPEQLRGEAADGRADLFAVGVLLHEMVTGAHPFDAGDVHDRLRRILEDEPPRLAAVLPGVTPFLDELVASLLAKPPEQRIDSASTLERVLEQGETSAWWAAHGRSDTVAAAEHNRTARETSLVGRDGEMRALLGAFERARGGHAGVVVVTGETGIGKTRLVDDFLAHVAADSRPSLRLVGAWSDSVRNTPCSALGEALSGVLGARLDAAALAPLAPSHAPLVPVAAALLRGESAEAGQQLPRAEAVCAVFGEVARSLASQAPLVLVLEDLHVAPPSAHALVGHLAAALRDAQALLVITTARALPDVVSDALADAGAAQRVVLSRLGPKDVGRVLVESLHSPALAEQIGYQVMVRSDGNPLFVLEILRSLRESGVLVRDGDGTWVRTASIRDVGIPATVKELVARRVAEVHPDDRELLDLAACAGTQFDPLLVGEVLGIDRIDVLRRFTRIERSSGLVRARGVAFVFDHDQLRRQIYVLLGRLMRRELHGALADAYERRRQRRNAGGDPKGEDAVFLAWHRVRSATPQLAGRDVSSAVRHLRGMFRFDAAADLLTRALAVPRLATGEARIGFLLLLARCHARLGRADQEAEAVSEAVAVADCVGEPASRSRARCLRGRMRFVAGRLLEAHDDLEAAVAFAVEADSRGCEARAYTALGHVRRAQGDLDGADRALERALECAVESEDGVLRTSVESALATQMVLRGRFAEAEARLDDALRSAPLETSAASLLRIRLQAASVAWFRGRLDDAESRLRDLLDDTHVALDRRSELECAANLGSILTDRMRFDEARGWLERAVAIARALGGRRSEAYALGSLALLDLAVGRLTEAEVGLHAMRGISDEVGDPTLAGRAHHGAARLFLVLGRLEDAGRHADHARRLAREHDAVSSECASALLAAEIASLCAARGRARQLLVRVVDALEPETTMHELARLEVARLDAAVGDVARAEAGFERSVAWFRGSGNAAIAASAEWSLGRLLAGQGRLACATTRLDAALALARAVGHAPTVARFLCSRARLPGGDIAAAVKALLRVEPGLSRADALTAHHELYLCTGEAARLADASEIVACLLAHAPAHCRARMVTDVPEFAAVRGATDARPSAGRATA